MTAQYLLNNLWILIAALLVFTMTISVGLLELGELGLDYEVSLMKTMLMTSTAIVVMAIVGFNTAFAPTLGGVIGNPLYEPGLLLGGFSTHMVQGLGAVWWSMGSAWANTGLTVGTYWLFETAFASVTLALVGVVVLRKVKPVAFFVYSIVYFVIIWNLPAAWIWNPSGWLARMGMADFAGGLVVHGAAAAAGLGIMVQIWREERAHGLTASPEFTAKPSTGWLTLSILLLWVGWFGFNPGSVLQFNSEAMVVVITTFVAAAASMLSTMFFRWRQGTVADFLYAVNGILMGLIVITPLAGFVSPASALVIGFLCGPLFLAGERFFGRFTWFSDPVGLLAGHGLGGLTGLLLIAFFTQSTFAAGSGVTLPDGLFFGGGMAALAQLGKEALGAVVVMVGVFALSYLTCRAIAAAMGGMTTDYAQEAAGEATALPLLTSP